MGKIGIWEIIIIVSVIILLFGAKKIPEIAKSIGLALKEFKKAGKEIQDDAKESPPDKDNGQKSS